jgi:membrane-associated protease RseP (regulator of RpoE activity)
MELDKKNKTHLIQTALFLVTIATTTVTGAEWIYGKYLILGDDLLTTGEVLTGLYFSLPFIGILTVHEFGHYFTAKYYKAKVTLPYYIPLWLGFIGLPSIGTAGAFIRIKSIVQSRKEFFDIGVAGPLAGFVAAILILTYGFTHLPEPDYIFSIHPEYQEYGTDYEQYVYDNNEINLAVGDNLLLLFFKKYVADPERVPNNYEIYHYPVIFAGFWALFFTALNLIPIGQLDGGHVIYGLFGYKISRIISRVLFLIMVTVSGISFIPTGPINVEFFTSALFYLLFLFLAFHHFEKDIKKRALMIIWIMIIQIFALNFMPYIADYGIYMMFAFLIGRFLGVDHPKVPQDKPLDLKRKIIGWLVLVSPN